MPPNTQMNLPGPFDQLDLPIQHAVAAAGYTAPTPIQEQCIPHLMNGADLLGSAQTGTGKTAAFVLPMLQRLSADPRRAEPRKPAALILAPTRELAAQIGQSIETYGRFLSLSHVVVYGGVSSFPQIKALHRGVDVLVATPGRLLDLMQQGAIQLHEVKVFVLDEMDRMLDMGFLPDIKRVLVRLPQDRQTVFFSATLTAEMAKLAMTMVRDPVRVDISPDQPAVERIAQKVLFVGKRNKDALLLSLLNNAQANKVLIFTQMKYAADRVAKKLAAGGIDGAAIHGNKSQAARTRALNDFKRGRVRVLVATDVAARGLDVDDISHVINYDLPMEAETYVHRIGRTARAGASGDAISFCCAEDRAYLRGIERLLGKPVPAEMEHAFHCPEAFHSRQSAPRAFGRGRSDGRWGGPARASKGRRLSQGRQRGRA
jgi:ATP-dependent RNA helicase RhlE